MAKQGQRLRTMQKNVLSDNKKVALEQEINLTIDAIMDEAEKYQALIENNEVKSAFVVFRSMEGKARLLQAYN